MRSAGNSKQHIDRTNLKLSPQLSNNRHQMASTTKVDNLINPSFNHTGSVNQWKIQQIPIAPQIQISQYLAHQMQNHMKSAQNHLVCTCPPEVHKALLEQQLIQLPAHHPHSHTPAQLIPQPHYQPCQHQKSLIKTVVTSSDTETKSVCSHGNQQPFISHIKVTSQPTVVESAGVNQLSLSYPTTSLQQAFTHSRQTSMPETMADARAQISKLESQLMYLTSWIQCNANQPNCNSVINQQNYVPSVTEPVGLSQHSNCLPCYIVTSDRIMPDLKEAHCTVEATPSNSSLDSAYSARSTASSDNNSSFPKQQQQQQQLPMTGNTQIYVMPMSEDNLSNKILIRIQENKNQIQTLKQEINQLKKLNTSLRVSIRNEINEASLKIKKLLESSPSANFNPIRNARKAIDSDISVYTEEVDSQIEKLEDLELAIEDLRINVLNRRCRVNIDEVEMLALHLSRISKCLATSKAEFPNVELRLKQVIKTEMELMQINEKFLSSEPKRLDSALKMCKKLISTLFTLKRLGSVQENAGSDGIPEIRSNREPSAKDRKAVLESIKTLVPDHSYRMQQIEQVEKLRESRKKMFVSHEALKFEKSLELAAKTLREIKLSPLDSQDGQSNKVTVGINVRESDSLSSLTDSDPESSITKSDISILKKDLTNKISFVQRLPLINDLTSTSSSDTSNDQDSSDNASGSSNRINNSTKLSLKSNLKFGTILKTSQHCRSNRSSKVAFNRMVKVEDGSEVLQLNCPDDEYDEDLSSITFTSPPPPPPPRLSSQDEVVNVPEADISEERLKGSNIWQQQYIGSISNRTSNNDS